MADEVRFRVTADDDEAIRAMNNVINSVQRGEDSFQDLSRTADRTFDQVARSATQANDAIQNTSQSIGQFGATIDRSTKQINLNSRAAGNLAFQLQDVFVQLGSGQGVIRTLIQQGPQITSIFGGVGNTFRFAGQQAREFTRRLFTLRSGVRALAASTGVLLALSVVAFLVDAASKSQDLRDEFTRLGGIVDELTQRFIKLGEATARAVVAGSLFLSGSYGLAAQQAAEATRAWNEATDDLAGSIQRAGDEALRLAEINRTINQQAAAVALANITLEQRARAARIAAEDESRTVRERVGLLREASQLEQEARANEISIIGQKLRIATDEKELNELNQKLAKLNAESATAELETRQEINALIQDSINKTRELTQTIGEASAALGGPAEVARFQYERALEAIQRLKDEASLLGLNLNFEPLERLAGLELERALDAAAGQVEDLPALRELGETVVQSTFEPVERYLDEQFALEVAQGLRRAEQSSQPIIDDLRDGILRAFDINENQLNAIVESFGTTYNFLTEAIVTETETQIRSQELVIEAIRDRVDETTRLLEEEQRKAAAGYANNVSRYEEQLEQQLKLQEEAETKRLELERKAARQRLIINSAEQVSNYILAITKLTAAEASKGIVGVATTIAGVALIASIIARARAQATEFQELPRFREGTPYLDGPGSGKSDSITARLSRGERVVPAEYNALIGGRAVSNEELVRTFKIGQLTEQRFAFDRPDFTDALRRLQADQQRIAAAKEERQFKAMQEAYQRAAQDSAEQMIAYWKTRPVEWIDDDGARVVERQEGNVIRRKRIKDV